jgi:hypothetical protein
MVQSHETKGIFSRFASKSKNASRTNTATSNRDNHGRIAQVANSDYNDTQRTQNKYKEAADQLEEAIKARRNTWGSFEFDELSGEPEGFDDLQFKNKINTVIASRENSIKDKTGWSKFSYIVECFYTAFSPLAKNFLMVARDAQSVATPLALFDYSNLM